MVQQVLQTRRFFRLFRMAALDFYPKNFFQVFSLPLVGDEAVTAIYPAISFTGALPARKAVFHAAMLQGTAGNRAGVIPKSTASAVPAQAHHTQPAEGDQRISSGKSFHPRTSRQSHLPSAQPFLRRKF